MADRIGVEKLRGEINRRLNVLRNGPASRQEQINLCYQIAELQDQVNRRNDEARAAKLLRAHEDQLADIERQHREQRALRDL